MLSHLKMMQDPENQDDFSFDAPGVPGVPGVPVVPGVQLGVPGVPGQSS